MTLIAVAAADVMAIVFFFSLSHWRRDHEMIVSIGAGAIAALVLVSIALFMWLRTPMRLFCGDCGKFMPSDTKWICGYCDHVNRDTWWYSFLYRCQRCKAVAHSYKCHHCGEFFYLGHERDARRYASKLPDAVPGETAEQARARHAREQEERQAEMRRLEDAVRIRNLEKQYEKVVEKPTSQDPVEQVVRGARSRLDILKASTKERTRFMREKKRLIEEVRNTPEFQELSVEEKQNTIDQIEDDFASALREL